MEDKLQELLERVEAATGPDREIDCLIHEWVNPRHTAAMRGMYYGEATGEYYEPEPGHPGGYVVGHAARVTASLDAALALVERVLPGKLEALFRQAADETYHWVDSVPDFRQRLIFAVLAALLRAKLNTETGAETNG